MKKKIRIVIILLILFGIYYRYNGFPIVNKWLFGTLTGEISVNVDGEPIDHSEIEILAKEFAFVEKDHEFYVKRRVRNDKLKYSMRMGFFGGFEVCCYKLRFTIKGDSLSSDLGEEQLTCSLEVPAEGLKGNHSDINIDIQESGGTYKAVCNVTHEYWNGNIAKECKEIELNNRPQGVSFDFWK